ncbi:drug/metabolite transporter (DMT)-like permease [Bacillus fengqiuensis]|nr:drug/metabolite transporter (DMT)-like permease [Bacillus fengqiuensis]
MFYIVLVFLGACSYGILSTFVKLAYAKGFLASEVIGSQLFFGCLMLWCGVLFFSRVKVNGKSILKLMLVGLTVCTTSIFYYVSLQTIPASIAIVLLFQFTWIGVVLEAIVERAFPSREKLVSIGILTAGTLLAGAVFEQGESNLDIRGVMFGLSSALSFALFIFFSGRVSVQIPSLNRSAFIATGSLISAFLILRPSFLVDGTLQEGLWVYGLLLGLFGLFIPTLFFAMGVPKIGSGLGTIVGAAELPMAVFMSSVVLGETVTPLQWGGVVLILFGIAFPQWQLYHQKKRMPVL